MSIPNAFHPRWIRRTAVVLAFPVAVVTAIACRIWAETRSIPFYIRSDLADEWRAAKEWWR